MGLSESYQVTVIGAGAAGMMAAIFAARGGCSTLLIEGTRDGGRKILISGGGRCNVLPSVLEVERYVTASSPHLLRKMLRSWPLAEQHRFFEQEAGLPLEREVETGKMFPRSGKARQVRDALVALVREAGAEIRFGSRVTEVMPERGGHGSGWRVEADDGATIRATSVIIATGGLSVPATGSDGAGFRFASGLGHSIHPTYPALTPLTAEPPVHAALAGVSLRAMLSAPSAGGSARSTGGFLFTHRGYSGPAVLDVSHVAVRAARVGALPQPVHVQWVPELDGRAWEELLRETAGGTAVLTLLRRHLPDRLAGRLMTEAAVDETRTLAQLRRTERAKLVELLTRYTLPWTGDEGYKKAEVTGGGVPLSEVDPRTMESRIAPGVFLCGEVLDAFGPIGGYNFCWAWATGRAAGRGAAQRTKE